MSTIEEAREQARKVVLDAAWAQFMRMPSSNPSDYAHAVIKALETRGQAPALLDATEPPSEDMGPAASCHLCVGAGGYEDYDGGWVGCSCQRTREPMRDADGDMISSGEHRKISMSGDSFFVCDTCTNVLGLNVRWDHASTREDHQAAVKSLPDDPAEDEREALVEVIRLFFQNWRAIGRVSPSLEVSIDSLGGAVDDLIELDAPKDGDYHEGFEEGVKVGRAGSGPRPITDGMVEAAAREYHERGNGEGSFARMSGHVRTSLSFRMECALRAAEEARR